ncbi:MAG: YcjF family protein [Gemmataceae bacterium]
MLEKVKSWFRRRHERRVEEELARLRARTPVPVFWLYGKTQSGKTSIVKFLTGADEAEIGRGFKPTTRFSREYSFPTEEAPLLHFLDTRGLGEPGYDAAVDLAKFNTQAHVVIATVKALDHAQETVLENLKKLRASQPGRPVVLALTCLHEGYPQQQHPETYPYRPVLAGQRQEHEVEVGPWLVDSRVVPEDLRRSLAEQCRRFDGLFDHAVPIDLTRAGEGFHEPNFGGEQLKQTLLGSLPGAYRQTLIALDEATKTLQDLHAERALPYIVGYSSLAATAGTIPVPWLDLLILPGIQTRMIYHLARVYGQPLTGKRFVEFATTVGLGMLVRQATRELVKFIPFAGSIAGSVLAGSSTFALGKAFCYYYRVVHQGHVPRAEDIKQYYREQLELAEQAFRKGRAEEDKPALPNAVNPSDS